MNVATPHNEKYQKTNNNEPFKSLSTPLSTNQLLIYKFSIYFLFHLQTFFNLIQFSFEFCVFCHNICSDLSVAIAPRHTTNKSYILGNILYVA